jgi:hypothetical protein
MLRDSLDIACFKVYYSGESANFVVLFILKG